MEILWNALALPSLLALAVAWAMAAFVLSAAPWNSINRRLAALLFLDGVAFGAASGLQPILGDRDLAFAAREISIVATLSLLWVYLLFLSSLDSPLTRPLRPRGVQRVLLALAILSPLLWFLEPRQFVSSMIEGRPGTKWYALAGPWLYILYYSVLGMAVFALAASFLAWRRAAPGSPARKRTGAAAIAFGVRDASNGIILGAVLLLGVPSTNAFLIVAQGFLVVAFILTLAYGILETQVFDLDLRMKSGVRRSVVVSTFILVSFAIGQIVQVLVQERAGDVTALIVAIVLAFALRPVERLADKAADLVIPSTGGDHLAQRRGAVYRAAVESALEEGDISEKEASILRRLRVKLGLDEADAAMLEADARRARGASSHLVT